MSSPRTVVLPAPYSDASCAAVLVSSSDGETATISLVHDGELIAQGTEFWRPEASTHTWWDCPDGEVLNAFGAFLSAALENNEKHDGWPVLKDEADHFLDVLMAEDQPW
jgi:hypothetical protein